MEQLLLTVDLLHRQNILHRDIKPDNILILDKREIQVCIADLGFACQATDKRDLKIKCGTPGYVDPSVLKGKPFTEKSDIFSLGCLLFNLVTGKKLFPGRDPNKVLVKNSTHDPTPIIDYTCQNISYECRDLIKKMILQDPQMRPTTEECLAHEWFQLNRESLENQLTFNKETVLKEGFMTTKHNKSNK